MIQNHLSGGFVAKSASSVLQKRRSALFWMVSVRKEALGKGVKRLWFRWLERLKTGVSSPGGIPEPPRNTNGPTTKLEAWQTQVMYQRKNAETQRTMVRIEPFLKL